MSWFKTPRELLADVPPEPLWVWDGYLAPDALTLLSGKPKCGKSTLALALSRAIVAGAPFLGRPTRNVPVVYISEESAGTLVHKLRCPRRSRSGS